MRKLFTSYIKNLGMIYTNPVVILLLAFCSLVITGFQTDTECLKAFKTSVTQDSVEQLVDWSDGIHYCNWTGIACDSSPARRVVSISLPGKQLKGEVSPFLGNMSSLHLLNLSHNSLYGSIPMELGCLKNLQLLDLGRNHFNGTVPDSIGNLVDLQLFVAFSNSLVGSIPVSVGKLENLRILDLSRNLLSGVIPPELGSCQKLLYLSLYTNQLSGGLPSQLGNLVSLEKLQLYDNSLSGVLPLELSKCKSLTCLDLSRNNLSGRIPNSFTNLTALRYLNLSLNRLEGSVPTAGIFRSLSFSSLSGNHVLCGKTLPRSCNKQYQLNTPYGFFVVVFAVLICGRCLRKQKTEITKNSESRGYLPSLLKKFNKNDLEIATNSFYEGNLIERKRLSTIYKGVILLRRPHKTTDEQQLVAVKQWRLSNFPAESNDCFLRQLKTWNNLKHRNLVKLLGYSWESNSKALVLEYMENGSLETIIHDPTVNRSRWTFSERLKVCVSVANALVYLHYDSGHQIVYCNLKPSIVLFDGDWEAHVSTFGTVRMLGVNVHDGSNSSSISVSQGTIGYLAPEYAYTSQVTTKADVFSFGILVMELITTRRPTETIEDTEFPLPITLCQFVEAALMNGPKRVVQVLSPDFASSVSVQEEEERLIDLLEFALTCTHPVPEKRPNMNEVLSFLLKLKEI